MPGWHDVLCHGGVQSVDARDDVRGNAVRGRWGGGGLDQAAPIDLDLLFERGGLSLVGQTGGDVVDPDLVQGCPDDS